LRESPKVATHSEAELPKVIQNEYFHFNKFRQELCVGPIPFGHGEFTEQPGETMILPTASFSVDQESKASFKKQTG
jgi:hypothetical protein